MYQNMPPVWFGPPSNPQMTIREQLQQAQEGMDALDVWKKYLMDKEKDKNKDKEKPKGKAYSSSDVWCLTLCLMFLSPGIGIGMLHFYAYLAGQYALAFKAFTP